MDRNTRQVEGQSDGRDMIVTHLSPEISRFPATACRRQNDRPAIPRAHNDRRPVPAQKAPYFSCLVVQRLGLTIDITSSLSIAGS